MSDSLCKCDNLSLNYGTSTLIKYPRRHIVLGTDHTKLCQVKTVVLNIIQYHPALKIYHEDMPHFIYKIFWHYVYLSMF